MSVSVIVYEDSGWQRLLPLVYMRPVFHLICGAGDLLSKVQRLLVAPDDMGREPTKAFFGGIWCRADFAALPGERTQLATNMPAKGNTLFLNGRGLWRDLPAFEAGEASWVGVVGAQRQPVCIFANAELASLLRPEILLDEARTRSLLSGLPRRDVGACAKLLDWPWSFIHENEQAMMADWQCASQQGHIAGVVDPGSYILGKKSVVIGAGTRVMPGVVINAEKGPVWIGKNAVVMPHTYIEGPVYIGDNCLVQPGSAIRDGSYIGPVCKVGGEIEASIVQGYSNKQHDGFLGHSYVGSWVNIAADCINSDLKNTYGTVRVPINGYEVDTGELFVGMLVGDHSKLGINAGFTAGSVIGFCSSVFASRSLKFVPSFSWLDGDRCARYDVLRGLGVAQKAMARRNRTMNPSEEQVFLSVARRALALERQLEVDTAHGSGRFASGNQGVEKAGPGAVTGEVIASYRERSRSL